MVIHVLLKDTSVNLQVAELEQHIHGMTDIERGITEDQRSHSHSSFSLM